MYNIMMKIIFWIWCFPQMLLGFFVKLFLKAEKKQTIFLATVYTFQYNSWFSGVSLGTDIILPVRASDDVTIHHEYGHCKQSFIFGPLYLLLIGLPSVIRNLWSRLLFKKKIFGEISKWYYSGYPENWADKLGGVKR